ncbi:hypothetical protein DM01DRAFT_1334270 [Hesseltinella vesiculosa]|uniref:Uncharacterized protein n=1 Tax=Hesseltinella vesiculosa TaxID=101127 RepID=A0A1X2GNN0_9FUNG|nr:hypothetical protein DM01DRAFT_1334270 [Hesseltinella vesiculosa]
MMTEHPNTENPPGAPSWSTVVARGRAKQTVPHMLSRRGAAGTPERLEHPIIFETKDIQQKWLVQKAAAIIQNTLLPDTVIFEFQAKDFDHYTDAYGLLVKKIGPLAGNGARPISRYGSAPRQELIIEAKFEDASNNIKAVKEGFTHQGVVYKAVPANSNQEGNRLQVVSLSQLPPYLSNEELVEGLCTSLRYFGVCELLFRLKFS